ncbi:MAG: single-stranded-DNA-specific exonuclease RecJ [Planctomycetaceae bacterium]|nr:single-stranded-DNA-specific exonuclease RecJ [Planctomycetaceae bacterium]
MSKRWRIHPHDPARIADLQRAAGVPAVVAELLICRGVTDPAAVGSFLDPKLSALRDPGTLPGCAAAAERIFDAISARRPIVVYGDYDVDGISGAALLWLCLNLLDANVRYYIPHRIDEGYGLNADAIRTLAEEGVKLIVTVDCGIAGVDEAALARELGIELIVSDHHEPGPRLPDVAALVHPRIPEGSYPFGGLSGSGVALKLAWAVCQRASGAQRTAPRMRNFLLQAVGLAALGTIADVVPLVDENRVLVRHGLESLANAPTLGTATLMSLAKVAAQRYPDGKTRLSAEDVAFQLAPRLNAAGRLGQPQLAVELLVTDRADRAAELAAYIDGLNSTRQTIERSIQLAAAKQAKELFDPVDDAALVLADHGWHPGVIGIVAGRLADRFHRPVVMISWDKSGMRPGVGSARSVPGFDLHAALMDCGGFLVAHGGHAAAAGLKIEEPQLDGFRAAFCEVAASRIPDAHRVAELFIDVEAPLSAFTLDTVRQLERLAPFGHGNTRPLLCTTGVTLAGPPKPLGATGHHLAMNLAQHGISLRAVAFGGGDWADDLAAVDGPLDIAFRPVINSFRGRQSVELHLVDWRPTEPRP